MNYPASTQRLSYQSPLGPMTLAGTDSVVLGIWFDGQAHQPDYSAWPASPQHALLGRAVEQLEAYFAGTRLTFELPLDFAGGTSFQRAVWQLLQDIAAGSTTSYGALGAALGRPGAARAIGAAVGRNPLSIVVPCHRVLGAGGALTGYAGGLERKVALLQLESRAA